MSAGGCAPAGGEGPEDLSAGKPDDVACIGATLDAHGYCRRPDGRFAPAACCELELLADCLHETEECLGHIEDEGYAEACGDEIDETFCVSTSACPAWVFEDPERSPHEILQIDISEQCSYVCADWLPSCMMDAGHDEAYDLAGAYAHCIEYAGCTSDICDRDADLCARATENFEESRDSVVPVTDPEPTEPEAWTLEQCRDEAEECLGQTEDETYLEACGDEPSGSVCVNEESCPAWIFEDPERSPLEILEIDISEQCSYICSSYLADCMYEAGWDEGTLEQAFERCIDDSGCPSTICADDPDLCAAATESFEDARG